MQGQRFGRFRVTTYHRSDQPSSLLLLSRQLKVSSTLSLIFGARLKSRTRKALYKVDITAKGRPFDQLQGRQNIDHTSKGSPVSAFFLIAGAQAGGKPSESCENVPTVMPQTLLSAGTRICTPLAFSSLEKLRTFLQPKNLNESRQLLLETGQEVTKALKLIQQIAMCFKCL